MGSFSLWGALLQPHRPGLEIRWTCCYFFLMLSKLWSGDPSQQLAVQKAANAAVQQVRVGGAGVVCAATDRKWYVRRRGWWWFEVWCYVLLVRDCVGSGGRSGRLEDQRNHKFTHERVGM